ncbi:hypothetical protein OJAV_G00186430 [Oryzias javanicus]|uniref:Uncharacterized protein n=1 Tax=Oryzias javanicus TaxID=123683 RepID=A0A437C9V0_ORYJA|nr:hypothetical protein OJAV_G00186430 [Oryzias javanicus]
MGTKRLPFLFQFFNRTLQKVCVFDPLGTTEEKDSEVAASRFRQYFKMQQIHRGKTDWMDVKWKHGVLDHSKQQDGFWNAGFSPVDIF